MDMVAVRMAYVVNTAYSMGNQKVRVYFIHPFYCSLLCMVSVMKAIFTCLVLHPCSPSMNF
ncbi:hypothetical protein BDW59DRAFT_93111 [Aspergillus cavernicola]|uniref:Uncharacterized protein n=1 Tax=Aspergillus cavernicola TaxID=176166 RepID=A0ABR4IYI3_9EURO